MREYFVRAQVKGPGPVHGGFCSCATTSNPAITTVAVQGMARVRSRHTLLVAVDMFSNFCGVQELRHLRTGGISRRL